jgi:choline dehydrogenase-like flavoprotein
MRVFELDRPLQRLGHEAYFARSPYDDSEPLRAAGTVVGGRVTQLDRLLTMTPLRTRVFGTIVFGSILPLETNCVRPGIEKDRFGLPQADIRLEYSREDKAAARKAKDDLFEVLADAGLRPSVRWDLEDPVPGSSVHYGGTARMHEWPEYGVTDAWGRLHSVRNVAIADASTFTTCVEKNPTLTMMALAHRAAGRLALDLQTGNLNTVAV